MFFYRKEAKLLFLPGETVSFVYYHIISQQRTKLLLDFFTLNGYND